MIIKRARKLLGMTLLLAAMAVLAMGCAGMKSGKGTYTSDRDAQAVYEMEWNLDPYR